MVTIAQFDFAMRHGVIPALVGVINAAVVKFGHSFTPFANMGLLQGGLIGVVQGVVSNVFFDGLRALYDNILDSKNLLIIMKLCKSHLWLLRALLVMC